MKVKEWLQSLLIFGNSREEKERLHRLQQQYSLSLAGIHTTAEIIALSVSKKGVARRSYVRLWIKLKKEDGSFIYTFTQTEPATPMSLSKGQVIQVKYLPGDPNSILVLGPVTL